MSGTPLSDKLLLELLSPDVKIGPERMRAIKDIVHKLRLKEEAMSRYNPKPRFRNGSALGETAKMLMGGPDA